MVSLAGQVRPVNRQLVGVGFVLLVLTTTATLLAAFAEFAWVADIAVHFRAQYAAGALLAALLLFGGARPRWASVALLIMFTNAWFVAASLRLPAGPSLAPVPRTARAGGDPAPVSRYADGIRVAALNVLHRNDEYDHVINWLRTEHADVVAIEEASPAWLERLAVLDKDYPSRRMSASDGRFRTLLLSRWPLQEPIQFVAEPDGRQAEAVALIRGMHLHVVAVHAVWPLTPEYASRRNREFARFAVGARRVREPLVLIGDFNSSALSPHFQNELLADGGLRSASAGRGWQPTWPAALLLFGIQIDHALVSPQVEVLSFRRGPRVGSDHRPIIVDLALNDSRSRSLD